MRVIKDIIYDDNKNVLDMYLPEGQGFKTIIWFHGGGLVSGDKVDGEKIAEGFVKAGYGFICANYRLYSKNAKFPEFIEDAAACVKFVKRNIKSYGGDDKSLIVSGQSAGAWISLMLCLMGLYLNKVGMDSLDILGWIIDSAQTTSHFNVLKYELGEDTRVQRINEFAPLYYVSENTKFTKILLICYDNDMACRYEQNMLFYKAIKTFNNSADIVYEILKGEHCHGSTTKDDDGEYGYVKSSLKWLTEKF